MIILDSNVISALMFPQEARLVRWLNAQSRASLWTTSICIYEIEFGIQSLPRGKRRNTLKYDFERALAEDLSGQVLDFDSAAAEASALISAELRRLGKPIDVRDAMIAGIVKSHHATLATRNTRHFEYVQVSLVNPWDDAARK